MKDVFAARRVNRAARRAFVSLFAVLARRVGLVEGRPPIARSDEQFGRRTPQAGILNEDLFVTWSALFADIQQSAARAYRRPIPPDHLSAVPGFLPRESLRFQAFAIGQTGVSAFFRPDLGMVAFPLNIFRVVLDARVAEKGDELRLQRRVEMHGYGLPIAAVTEIDREEAGVIVRITAPVLDRDPAALIGISVDIGDPIFRIITFADLIGASDICQKICRAFAKAVSRIRSYFLAPALIGCEGPVEQFGLSAQPGRDGALDLGSCLAVVFAQTGAREQPIDADRIISLALAVIDNGGEAIRQYVFLGVFQSVLILIESFNRRRAIAWRRR